MFIRYSCDCLDGAVARKYNKVSDIGGFLDTVADNTLIYILVYGILNKLNYTIPHLHTILKILFDDKKINLLDYGAGEIKNFFYLNNNLKNFNYFYKDQNQIENLVKKVSTEKHPRSILNELERLNIVKEEDGLVVLQQRSWMPDVEQFEVRKLLANNLEAHLAAGVHNLFQPEKEPYLEQAIFADELTDESITLSILFKASSAYSSFASSDACLIPSFMFSAAAIRPNFSFILSL